MMVAVMLLMLCCELVVEVVLMQVMIFSILIGRCMAFIDSGKRPNTYVQT